VYTGYAAELLPGVQETIAWKEWAACAEQLRHVQAAIDRVTPTLQLAIEKAAI
jgi:hypothetical protein